MDSRMNAWRKRPPTALLPVMEQAVDLRLFLIKEVGPTVFVFKDEEDNVIKVSLGLELSCSLCNEDKDHCIHTQYVLQRIFRLDVDHPLLWQTSYRDNDISDLCAQRDKPDTRGNKKHNFLKRRSQTSSRQTKPSKETGETSKIRKVFDESDSCPICQEPLNETQGITFCRMRCGSNFHVNCLFVWTDYRYQISEKISCPMCRAEWGLEIYEKIKKEKEAYDTRYITHKGHKCSACKTMIKGRLFHCLYCENTEICERCFLGFEHYSHDRFLVKETVNDSWKIARIREKMFLKKSLGEFGGFRQVSIAEEANSADQRRAMLNLHSAAEMLKDHDAGQDLCVDRVGDWDKFISSCFQNFVAAQNNKANDALGFALKMIGREISKKCVLCNKESVDTRRLKRLFCGHAVDEDCLAKAFKEQGKFSCPEDNLEQLKGWTTAFKQQIKANIKPQNKSSKEEVLPKINSTMTFQTLETDIGRQNQQIKSNFQKENGPKTQTKSNQMISKNDVGLRNHNSKILSIAASGKDFEIEGSRMNYSPPNRVTSLRQYGIESDTQHEVRNGETSLLQIARNEEHKGLAQLRNQEVKVAVIGTKKKYKVFGLKKVVVNEKITGADIMKKNKSVRGNNQIVKGPTMLGTKKTQKLLYESRDVVRNPEFETTMDFQDRRH